MSCYLRCWLPDADQDMEIDDMETRSDQDMDEQAPHVGHPMWTDPPLVLAKWLRAKQTSPTPTLPLLKGPI